MYGTVGTSEQQTLLLSGVEGGGGGSAGPSKSTLSIPRERLVEVISKRAERAASCSRVPFALLVYILTCWVIISHGHSTTAYDMESTLNQVAVNSGDYGGFLYEVYSANSWLDYFAGAGTSEGTPDANTGWINAVISNRDNGVNIPMASNLRGRIRDAIKIIGGIHLIQARRAPQPCIVKGTRSLYGTCHGGTSFAPFGDPAAFINADDKNVSSAFKPTPSITSPSSPVNSSGVFQYWLSEEDTRGINQRILQTLDTAGWLDGNTASVTVEFAVLNGEIGYVGRVALASQFTNGGRVETSASIISLPIDPYGQYPILQVMDTFVVVWLIYCLTCLLYKYAAAANAGNYWKMVSYWYLLDVVYTFTLLAAVAQYGIVIGSLGSLGLDPFALPSAYSGGCSTCLDTYSCCSVGNNILAASTKFETFKNTAVIHLIAATGMLFYYFSFQPRLAVFSDAFFRAFPDIVHFSIVFGVMVAMFGVWGHFQFGSLAPDWHTVSGSIIAVFRFLSYDYDLVIMEQKNREFADAFFVLAMYLVTNLFLWTLLGIVLEVFSVVMNERTSSPSIFDELWQLALWLWGYLSSPSTLYRYLTVQANVVSPRPFGVGGKSADSMLPPYHVITTALTGSGPMAHVKHVTPEIFAAALGVSIPTAGYLIAQVLATKEADAQAGWSPALPADMEAALRDIEASASAGAAAAAGLGVGSGFSAPPAVSRSKTVVFARMAQRARDLATEGQGEVEEGKERAALGQLLQQVRELSDKVEALGRK